MSNKNLQVAKKRKRDEFYTRYEDIAKEMEHYKEYFKNKTVYLPCDNAQKSNFWKYFSINFNELGLYALFSTYYDTENKPLCSIIWRYNHENDDGFDILTKEYHLEGNGDFRSDEIKELMTHCSVIITNPPFSLWRDFFNILVDSKKDFIILGTLNVITYKNVYPYFKDGWLHSGYGFNQKMSFENPYEPTYTGYNNICWFTNISIEPKHFTFSGVTYKENESKYPKYENYDAINVDKLKDIPCDYDGVMGVPITFMGQYNPDEFEIISFGRGEDGKYLTYSRERERERE